MKKTLLILSLIASFTLNAQWTEQGTGFDVEFRGLSQIQIIDANTVWALAYDGSGGGENIQEFTRTTDGGTTWTAGQIAIGDDTLEINNLCAVSADVAWVSAIINVAAPGDQSSNGVGFIFKTTDGGASWEQQLSAGFQVAGTSFLNAVYFFDENVGIAYGDPLNGEYEIWRTTNGGTDWTLVPAASIVNPLANEFGYNSLPIYAGGTLRFTTNRGRLYKSSDMGATWTANQVTALTDFGADTQNGTAIFRDANNGYVLRTVRTGTLPANYVFTRTFSTTVDGGTTWSTFAPFTGTRYIINYIPGTTTIVATSAAAPVGTSVSTNNGSTWISVESTAQRGSNAFLNATTGWAAGFSSSDPFATQGIFKLTGPLGVDTAAIAKFKVYPNPATSIVTISTPDVDSADLSVTDLTGKVVMTKSLSGIENTVDISKLATGAYFFEINSDSKKEVVKILKN